MTEQKFKFKRVKDYEIERNKISGEIKVRKINGLIEEYLRKKGFFRTQEIAYNINVKKMQHKFGKKFSFFNDKVGRNRSISPTEMLPAFPALIPDFQNYESKGVIFRFPGAKEMEKYLSSLPSNIKDNNDKEAKSKEKLRNLMRKMEIPENFTGTVFMPIIKYSRENIDRNWHYTLFGINVVKGTAISQFAFDSTQRAQDDPERHYSFGDNIGGGTKELANGGKNFFLKDIIDINMLNTYVLTDDTQSEEAKIQKKNSMSCQLWTFYMMKHMANLLVKKHLNTKNESSDLKILKDNIKDITLKAFCDINELLKNEIQVKILKDDKGKIIGAIIPKNYKEETKINDGAISYNGIKALFSDKNTTDAKAHTPEDFLLIKQGAFEVINKILTGEDIKKIAGEINKNDDIPDNIVKRLLHRCFEKTKKENHEKILGLISKFENINNYYESIKKQNKNKEEIFCFQPKNFDDFMKQKEEIMDELTKEIINENNNYASISR